MTLHSSETGSGEPTFVLLHAFPLDGRMWDGVVAAADWPGRRLVPDLPGFGASRNAPAEGASMNTYARAVLASLDAAGVGFAVIAGCSMGGYLAFELWRQAPERIRGLVLCDTRAEPDTDEARANRAKQAEKVVVDGAGFLADLAAEKFVSESSRQNDQFLDQLRRMVLDQSPAAIANALSVLGSRPDSWPDLPSIDVPTLIIVGEEDKVTPPALSEAMHQAIPKSQLMQIPNAGHLAPMEQPANVASAIREFMA